ncbi:MAG: exodeoxyribonuclease III [Vampirovibrionales bacterium]|nr:exodeoxyribonuclease III [Vampirovibrionales bacterium]
MTAVWNLYSWNVNGIRAAITKGFWEWFDATQPDILALQETKISADQLTFDLITREGYKSYWNHADKRGYSGVAVFTKHEPLKVEYGFGMDPKFDNEGRSLMLEFEDFVFYGIYFPNGQRDDERLNYKLAFYDAWLEHAQAQRAKGKAVVVCGDVNTAHFPIDLARPKANEKVSGFLPIERAWMDKLVAHGYTDTFRHKYPDKPDQYSWWNMRSAARERNVGWRIDYFFTSDELKGHIVDAAIHPNVMGSDHCPVSLTLAM